ncbi:MAG: DDE-type integrase/transposase/recombinase [Acidobacteriia bacterium]|nr:DDE-type integrase/transposase/recombinase [Terriglobia bacterium]
MNRLSAAKRAQVVAALVEGNSVRSTVRMTGVAKNTITKLLVELGAACSSFLDHALVNLPCKRVQCDEIWSYVAAKEKNVTPEMAGAKFCGDAWTWIALDADSKLICSWLVGKRDPECAQEFIKDLAGRLAHRVQLTTDGLRLYLTAIADNFGSEIDYAMLVKIYGNDPEAEKRYSPAVCTACKKENKIGDPNPKDISTSYVERQNLTMRMHMRRFTRLTNAFSKKLENHTASVAIHVMYYNFCRIHQTLRVAPAMAAGLTGTLWSVYDLVTLLEASTAEQAA